MVMLRSSFGARSSPLKLGSVSESLNFALLVITLQKRHNRRSVLRHLTQNALHQAFLGHSARNPAYMYPFTRTL